MGEVGWVRLRCVTPLGASGPWIIPLDLGGSSLSPLSFQSLFSPSDGDNPGRQGDEAYWRKLPEKQRSILETREILLQFSRLLPLKSPLDSRSQSKLSTLNPEPR